jgi:DNA-binding LacI/PurR family transcriptional regulator
MRRSFAAALLAAGFILFCSRAPAQPATTAVTIHSHALNPRPDDICFSDNVASGVLEACAHHGIRVPEILTVVGNADLPFAGMLEVSLTTIRQPQALLGRRAVELLLKCMEKKRHSEQIVLPVELIVRESTGGPLPSAAAVPPASPQPVADFPVSDANTTR